MYHAGCRTVMRAIDALRQTAGWIIELLEDARDAEAEGSPTFDNALLPLVLSGFSGCICSMLIPEIIRGKAHRADPLMHEHGHQTNPDMAELL